jgi:UTP--glucose-1-phosphate uridylyltransferase
MTSAVKIKKAVFPVAGLGTRFLPATKASPKEMLPVVDKPIIQYAAEEAIAAGATELIFITGRHKRSIEDHFDASFELEYELAQKNKQALLNVVRDVLPSHVSCVYIRQPKALGLGHAVLCAERVVGHEPFMVILADDLIDAETPAMKQMVDIYTQQRASVIGVQPILPEETTSYGVIQPLKSQGRLFELQGIIEKPAADVAPSLLGVVGRYVLTPAIFDILRHQIPGAGGEIQLTDGISTLLKYEKVWGYEFEGTRFDCGSKLGYLKATIELALKHPELAFEFREFLRMKTTQY